MITLIFFEFKKFFTKRKNIIAIIVFSLIIFIYIFISLNMEKRKLLDELPQCEFAINSVQEGLKSINENYNINKNSDDIVMLNKMKKIITSYEKQLDLLSKKKSAIINKDWKEKLAIEIELDKDLLNSIQQGNVLTSESNEVIQSRLIKNEILLDKGIEPIYLDCSMTSFNFIRLASINIAPLILVILIILFSADAVSNEIDDGTFKLLLLQPISRKKVMIAKIIAYTTINIIIVSGIFFLFFGILAITKGIGSSNYPVSYYTGNLTSFFGSGSTYETTWISINRFDLHIIPLYILFIITIVALTIMVSIIIGNNSGSISTSIIIYVALYIFNTQLNLFGNISPFIITSYSNIPLLLDGTAEKINPNITYMNGILILSITTIICYIISFLIFRKKDIL